MPKHVPVQQDFFATWSHEMAYVLGYFAADGSMIHNRRGAHFIEFTSTDRVLLEQVRSVAGSAHAISLRPKRNKLWKNQYRLQIGSKIWYEDLHRLGFTQHKSHTLRFPKIPSRHMPSFVRGYFDGDGGVYLIRRRGRRQFLLSTSFTSGSELFLADLRDRLDSYVGHGSLVRKVRGYELKYSQAASLALYAFMYDTGEVAGPFLPRKRAKFEQALAAAASAPCGRSSTG